MTVMKGRREMVVHGKVGTAAIACRAAVPGSTLRGVSVPPSATGSPPGSATTSLVSALPRRLLPESLPPGGQGDLAHKR